MNKKDYEKYYQTGGSYIIPVEIFNELFDDYECFKNDYQKHKEFINYLERTIEELECDDVDDEEMKGYLIQRIDTFKEILSKYKEIIGVSDENNT